LLSFRGTFGVRVVFCFCVVLLLPGAFGCSFAISIAGTASRPAFEDGLTTLDFQVVVVRVILFGVVHSVVLVGLRIFIGIGQEAVVSIVFIVTAAAAVRFFVFVAIAEDLAASIGLAPLGLRLPTAGSEHVIFQISD
jgi:hypothetical protein